MTSSRHDLEMLGSRERLEFEHLLQWLRLSFLLTPLLVLVAFGAAGVLYALVIASAVAVSFTWVGLLTRYRPALVLRGQLWLRVLDCVVVYVVLVNYHAFLRNAYYDSVYVLFVVAAAATHGRRGAWILSLVAGGAVLLSRLQLIASGAMPYEVRHLTDAVFYTLFFLVTSSAVAFLMRKSAEVVVRRERELVTGVTHDLRTPLTVIKVQAQLMRRRTASPDPQLLGSIEHIERAATRMARWIEELLDVTRVQTEEELDLDRQPTDLVCVAREIVADHQAGTQRHLIELEVQPESIVGMWDAPKLARVFDNLVGNAIKYSPTGGRVMLSLRRQDGWAIAAVQDEGMGIPSKELPYIFEPFRRASNVIGHIGGTGIGLASTYRIVVWHGGSMDVESREGEGSTFTVRLPIGAAEAG